MVVDYLRSAALEHFKTEVEISVGRGEGFTYSVNMCKQTSMLNFDRGCAGAAHANFSIYLFNFNLLIIRKHMSLSQVLSSSRQIGMLQVLIFSKILKITHMLLVKRSYHKY